MLNTFTRDRRPLNHINKNLLGTNKEKKSFHYTGKDFFLILYILFLIILYIIYKGNGNIYLRRFKSSSLSFSNPGFPSNANIFFL